MTKGKRILNGWYKLRWQILERDSFTCRYCGRSAPDVMLEVDHRISLADGGDDNPDNLVASCMACNRGKSGLRQSLLLAKARQYKSNKEAQDKLQQLLSEHQKGLTVKQISAGLNKTSNSVRVMLSKLKKRSAVDNPQPGLWRLKQS